MKIGTYYKLPDGRKGLYVGMDRDKHNLAVRRDNGLLYLWTTNDTDLEEYREPRVFEDEVLVVEDVMVLDGKPPYFITKNNYSPEFHNIIGRKKVVVTEGEGL